MATQNATTIDAVDTINQALGHAAAIADLLRHTRPEHLRTHTLTEGADAMLVLLDQARAAAAAMG